MLCLKNIFCKPKNMKPNAFVNFPPQSIPQYYSKSYKNRRLKLLQIFGFGPELQIKQTNSYDIQPKMLATILLKYNIQEIRYSSLSLSKNVIISLKYKLLQKTEIFLYWLGNQRTFCVKFVVNLTKIKIQESMLHTFHYHLEVQANPKKKMAQKKCYFQHLWEKRDYHDIFYCTLVSNAKVK